MDCRVQKTLRRQQGNLPIFHSDIVVCGIRRSDNEAIEDLILRYIVVLAISSRRVYRREKLRIDLPEAQTPHPYLCSGVLKNYTSKEYLLNHFQSLSLAGQAGSMILLSAPRTLGDGASYRLLISPPRVLKESLA